MQQTHRFVGTGPQLHKVQNPCKISTWILNNNSKPQICLNSNSRVRMTTWETETNTLEGKGTSNFVAEHPLQIAEKHDTEN